MKHPSQDNRPLEQKLNLSLRNTMSPTQTPYKTARISAGDDSGVI